MPKQLLPLGGRPILQRAVDAFARNERITDIVVALPADLAASPPGFLRDCSKPLEVIDGGIRRQDSVARACTLVSADADIIVIHDAARPLVSDDLISRTIDAASAGGAAIAALRVTDTVKRADDRMVIVETLPRDEIFLAQTPQAFRASVLRASLTLGESLSEATDEAALVERAGYPVHLVDGDPHNVKITTAGDLLVAERILMERDGQQAMETALRIGNGYDLHRLVAGRPLVLGGVVLPFEKGLAGHSDADVVCHAVTDALLGAAGAGDIGRHFPDTEPEWRGADSLVLLARAAGLVASCGYAVVNVDVVVIAQQPRLAPHVDAMCANLARALGIDASQVSVKGKTNEGVDSTGAGDAIAAHAVALIQRAGGSARNGRTGLEQVQLEQPKP